MRIAPVLPAATLALVASTSGFAAEYLSAEQARAAMFPGAAFEAAPLTLTPDQAKAVAKKSGAGLRSREVRAWRVSTGGWFFVDEVLGKHEFITYAVGLDAAGAVVGVEILVYRESYGDQVRNPAWRGQFTGKKQGAALTLAKDIQNISGATLSSRHITDGIKRLLATYAIAIAQG